MAHDRSAAGGQPDAADERAAEQVELPLEGADEPIGYVLTARARMLVAPESLPELTVVEPARTGMEDDEADRHDARRVRARALRRAGMGVSAIAAELGVGSELVRAWCAEVAPTTRRRTRDTDRSTPPAGARMRARTRAAGLLAGSGATAVAGVVVAASTVNATSVALSLDGSDLVEGVVAWLVDEAGADPSRIRVHIEAGDGLARDLLVRDWATRLHLDREQVSHARWHDAPDLTSTRVTVRVPDALVAAAVAGWRDAIAASSTASQRGA